MGRVVDSSVLIAAERGTLDLPALRAACAGDPLVIAAITASELLGGVHRATSESQRALREAFVDNVLRSMRVVPFDLGVARTHARLRARLPRHLQIGAHDLLIGATAVAFGYRVLTRDRRSFPRIPDLGVDLA